jgi:2-polyprenyl-6-methoxyphenol hydroxylase-like FAD-dependent oxidoreductase
VLREATGWISSRGQAEPNDALAGGRPWYDRRPTRAWSRGRVALIGDAIHAMTPDLAQGACQAIVDATTLATCLAGACDSRAALRDYQQRRWRNAALTTLLARNMGTMGQWNGRITCTARNTLTRAIPLSLQLRQFDLVLGGTRPARDNAGHPDRPSPDQSGERARAAPPSASLTG